MERDKNIAKFWLEPVRLQNSGGFGRSEINRLQRIVETNQEKLLRGWYATLPIELQTARAMQVKVTDEAISVDLADGRTISAPLAWFPRLLHGRSEERQNWRLIGDGHGIHWPDLDEDISTENLLLGRHSGESQGSLKRWLESRGSPTS